MRVPLSWLRDFAPVEADPADLALTLDDLGLVVESIERVGDGLEGVVVARVLAIEPIPSADLIRLVTVDAGDRSPVDVVCGASNLAVGHLVPLATVGTALPEAPDLRPRLPGRVLVDVKVGASPQWVARRLVLAGMRPINSVVDASNYVMLELGQPTHPYDLDRLPGHGLLVRRARTGETLVTLDGEERRLAPDDCLICDAESTPVGVAGIMGGASSEIS